jgi:hypothetical protein
MEQD